MIEVNHLSFGYESRPVLKDVSFKVKRGQLVSIMGPNGVGKSTLFRCLLGINKQYEGKIAVEGMDLKQFSVQALAEKIAYIPQFHESPFNYTVLEMVVMGMAHKVPKFGVPGKKVISQAYAALDKLNMGDFAHRGFNKLSGGERQMVLIARALAQNAQIFLMDEPTSSLDFGNQAKVMKTVKQLTSEGYTVLLSCHNPQQVLQFSDEVIVLDQGRVSAVGHPESVITKPMLDDLYQTSVEVFDIDGERFIRPSLGRRCG